MHVTLTKAGERALEHDAPPAAPDPNACGAERGDGLTCVRPQGHPGRHHGAGLVDWPATPDRNREHPAAAYHARRRAEVDAKVYDAALSVLAQEGRSGFTVEAVAERSGVAKTTIYRRHADADALAAATVRHALVPLTDGVPMSDSLWRALVGKTIEAAGEIVNGSALGLNDVQLRACVAVLLASAAAVTGTEG
ncbi:MAG: helix-turn-helix domain containing protein [Patulibacter minatonensis]